MPFNYDRARSLNEQHELLACYIFFLSAYELETN